MTFIQTIHIETDDIQPVQDLLRTWHAEQAGVAPGYQRARLLADESRSQSYVIEVDFSSKDEAQANNDRPETATWAQKLEKSVRNTPTFTNHELVFTTD